MFAFIVCLTKLNVGINIQFWVSPFLYFFMFS